jgi:C-terminal processing protease CtpA/Prc
MSRDEIRDAFTGLRTGMEEAVAGVLSPSQYTQFQEQFSRSFGGFGDRGNRGGGGGGPGGGGFLGGGGAAPGGGF